MNKTILSVNDIQFIITNCPQNKNLEFYKNLLINEKVNLLIRIIDEVYPIDIEGLTVVDFPEYKDGTFPNKDIIQKYKKTMFDIKQKYKNPIIAIHCRSSLGRTACFIALEIYWCKIYNNNYDIINYIRKYRPGSFNKVQLNWFFDYKESKTSISQWKKFINYLQVLF